MLDKVLHVIEEADDDWCCDVAGPQCLKPTMEASEPPLPFSMWVCDECDWLACDVCLFPTVENQTRTSLDGSLSCA